jgi:hypothetical protein
MAAFMDESGVTARIGYSPIRETLRSHPRIIQFPALFQNIRSVTYQIPNSLTGQQWNASHFNINLAEILIDCIKKKGGGAVMR